MTQKEHPTYATIILIFYTVNYNEAQKSWLKYEIKYKLYKNCTKT